MKNLLLILLVIISCTIFSCKKEENFDLDKFPQTWTLVTMYNNMPNSERSGVNMQWQEFYLLKSDGTFIKHRVWNGVDYETSGNFEFVDKTGVKYLELTYQLTSPIIGSCYGQTESLWLKPDNKLSSTWSECDGPGLLYEREE